MNDGSHFDVYDEVIVARCVPVDIYDFNAESRCFNSVFWSIRESICFPLNQIKLRRAPGECICGHEVDYATWKATA